jgi:hypothetical protein
MTGAAAPRRRFARVAIPGRDSAARAAMTFIAGELAAQPGEAAPCGAITVPRPGAHPSGTRRDRRRAVSPRSRSGWRSGHRPRPNACAHRVAAARWRRPVRGRILAMLRRPAALRVLPGRTRASRHERRRSRASARPVHPAVLTRCARARRTTSRDGSTTYKSNGGSPAGSQPAAVLQARLPMRARRAAEGAGGDPL